MDKIQKPSNSEYTAHIPEDWNLTDILFDPVFFSCLWHEHVFLCETIAAAKYVMLHIHTHAHAHMALVCHNVSMVQSTATAQQERLKVIHKTETSLKRNVCLCNFWNISWNFTWKSGINQIQMEWRLHHRCLSVTLTECMFVYQQLNGP
jgi:hypothetical protein